jgi:hypothetical protein
MRLTDYGVAEESRANLSAVGRICSAQFMQRCLNIVSIHRVNPCTMYLEYVPYLCYHALKFQYCKRDLSSVFIVSVRIAVDRCSIDLGRLDSGFWRCPLASVDKPRSFAVCDLYSALQDPDIWQLFTTQFVTIGLCLTCSSHLPSLRIDRPTESCFVARNTPLLQIRLQ